MSKSATPSKIIVFDSHDDLYYFWKKQQHKSLHIVHIDPHCDLFGAIIYQNRTMRKIRNEGMHEGNFLVTAVEEGIVDKIDWVFDDFGNRKYDVMTVLFEDDSIMRLPGMAQRYAKLKTHRLEYARIHYTDWAGMPPKHHLSLDWDFFAFYRKPKDQIQANCDEFLNREWKVLPEITYVCYSHEYVHPSVVAFIQFIDRLANRFEAEIEYFTPAKAQSYHSNGATPNILVRILKRLMEKVNYHFRRLMHKVGIHYG